MTLTFHRIVSQSCLIAPHNLAATAETMTTIDIFEESNHTIDHSDDECTLILCCIILCYF